MSAYAGRTPGLRVDPVTTGRRTTGEWAKKRESLGGKGKEILPDLKGQSRDVVADNAGIQSPLID